MDYFFLVCKEHGCYSSLLLYKGFILAAINIGHKLYLGSLPDSKECANRVIIGLIAEILEQYAQLLGLKLMTCTSLFSFYHPINTTREHDWKFVTLLIN